MAEGSIWIDVKFGSNGELVGWETVKEPKVGDTITSINHKDNSSKIIFGEKVVSYNKK